MTTQGKLHILISVWSLSSGNKLLCLCSQTSTSVLFSLLWQVFPSSVTSSSSAYHPLLILSTFLVLMPKKSYAFVNYKRILCFSLFPVIASFSPYSEGLLSTQSAHIYKLTITVPVCSAPLFSILSSAFPRPAQEEQSTKRDRLKQPFHYIM